MRMATWLAVVPLAVGLAAGGGCAGPSGAAGKDVPLRRPPVDGHYTGVKPDFAGRFNPDPLGRKFRVAFLTLQSCERHDGETDDDRVERMMVTFARHWMVFREQAAQSKAATRELNVHSELGKAFRASLIASRKSHETTLQWHLSSRKIVDPDARAFAWFRDNLTLLNAELEELYPNLFSSDESAFPLDIVLLMAWSPASDPVESLYEAWVVGLPEHAVLEGWRARGGIFRAEEGYTDPHDAIAAALFKLTDGQFEGLAPANPRDHDWLEGK